MTGDELRKSILAAAVRGALCPQDETDEPASALLARIREEKKKLIQEGKRKKEKNPTEIIRGTDGRFYERGNGKETDITDDLPFDIPDSWEWVRLGEITYPVGSKYNQILTKEVKQIGSIPVVSQSSNLIDGYTEAADKVIRDLPLVMFGDHTRNVKYIDFEFVIGADGTKFHKIIGCNAKYIYYWMTHAAATLRIRGYARHYSLLRGCFIPIPPLAEQKRIVERLETLRPLIDEYTRMEAEETARRKALPDDIKKSVLAHAVRGALCPQDETDEPAAALLARIREEKKKLIQEGKRKKEKNPTEIHRGPDGRFYETENGNQTDITDDLPFEIPDSWEWEKIKNIGTVIGGGTPKTDISEYWDGNIPWLTPADFGGYKNMYISSGKRTITEEGLNSSSARLLPKGTVLFSSRAPIGYIAIAENPIATNQGFKSVVPFEMGMNKFLYYCLMAFTDEIKRRASGTTFKEISGSELGEIIIPVPPLAEQKRIAARLTQILSALEELKGQN